MATRFLLIFVLLVLTNACGSAVSNSAVPPVSENRKIVIPPINIDENREFGKDCHTTFETEFALILTKNTSPVMIASVVSVNGKKDFKEGVDMEIKNVSDKTISAVVIDIDSQPHCFDNLSVATMEPAPADEIKAVMNPGELAVKHFPAKEAKNVFKLGKCCEPMANRPKKVMISIRRVRFSDGLTWSPGNNCLEDTVSPSPSPSNKP